MLLFLLNDAEGVKKNSALKLLEGRVVCDIFVPTNGSVEVWDVRIALLL